jgi:hypothetical protein
MRRIHCASIHSAFVVSLVLSTQHAHAQSSSPPISSAAPPTTASRASSASPRPEVSASDVLRVHVRFEGDEPGFELREVTAFGTPSRPLCSLPCTAYVPADTTGPRRLVLRTRGRQVLVDAVRFDEADTVRLRYVPNWRWRVAGGVILGAHATALTVALAVLLANHVDLTFGTGNSSDGALGFAYGYFVGTYLGVPLAMLFMPDRAAIRRAPAAPRP